MATKKVMTLQRLTYYDQKLKAWIKTLSSTHVEFVSVQTLPQTGESNKIYLVDNSGSGQNVKDEYIYLNGKWEVIGSTAADLAGYVKTTDLANTLKSYSTTEEVEGKISTAKTEAINAAKDYTDGLADNYATAEQGRKADSALQSDSLKTINGATLVGSGNVELVKPSDLDAYVKDTDLVEITEAEIDALFAAE